MDRADRTLKKYASIFFLCQTIVSLVAEIIAYKCGSIKWTIIFSLVFLLSLVFLFAALSDPDNSRHDGFSGSTFGF